MNLKKSGLICQNFIAIINIAVVVFSYITNHLIVVNDFQCNVSYQPDLPLSVKHIHADAVNFALNPNYIPSINLNQ